VVVRSEADRPTWHHYFLGIAETVARRADCRRRAVGAVVVGRDHRILATGYNGTRPGYQGCLAGGCPRGLLSYEDVAAFSDYNDPASPGYCISTHAEMNALLYAGTRVTGATVYVTDPPCPGCFKALGNAGIDRLVHPDPEKGFRVVQFAEMPPV
jgi:dCMP deaminase